MEEREFLKNYSPEDYDRPSITADILIFTLEQMAKPRLKILLIRRAEHPYKGCWALPGGFVRMEESLDEAAERELKEETGLEGIYLEQLYTFGRPDRDPRMRILTSAYMALIPEGTARIQAGGDASEAAWFTVDISEEDEQVGQTHKILRICQEELGIEPTYRIQSIAVENGVVGSTRLQVTPFAFSADPLAFDHAEIIGTALERIAGKCEYTPILFNLMPEEFTIPELQSVYELILKKRPHNTLFRKQMAPYIIESGNKDKRSKRPAQLYRYIRR